MNSRQYLFDENVDPILSGALTSRSPEIVVAQIGDPGVPPRATLDPAILAWCEANGFTLVTNNRASMPVHLRDHTTAGRHVPGIVMLNPSMSVAQTVEELTLIWAAARPDEYLDQVAFLPIRA